MRCGCSHCCDEPRGNRTVSGDRAEQSQGKDSRSHRASHRAKLVVLQRSHTQSRTPADLPKPPFPPPPPPAAKPPLLAKAPPGALRGTVFHPQGAAVQLEAVHAFRRHHSCRCVDAVKLLRGDANFIVLTQDL